MEHQYKINKIKSNFKYFRSEYQFDMFCIYTLPYISNWNMTSFEKTELMNEIEIIRQLKKQDELKRLLKQQQSLIRDI